MYTARAITLWLILLPLPTFSLLGMDKQKLSLWQRFKNKFYYIQPSAFSSVDSCQIQGARYSQQDFLINQQIKGIHCIGIADGHESSPASYSTNRENSSEWINSTGKKYAILTRMAPQKSNQTDDSIVDIGGTAARYIAETVPTLIAQNLPESKPRHGLKAVAL